MAKIIDGKKLAAKIRDQIAVEVDELKHRGITPGLAVVLVGTDPASQVYVRNKRAACRKTGIASFLHDLPEETSEHDLLSLISHLNGDPAVHGILVQLPLPAHISDIKVIEAIDPAKDVDCFHPMNLGLLLRGEPRFLPCTAAGIIELIESAGMDIAGKRAAVIGRSMIVGKPTAVMLVHRHATVTICHTRTADLPDVVCQADIVVAAAGKPGLVKGSWIKKGAVVIDVGISKIKDGRIVGDCDFESVSKVAGWVTPVPGGVGPMTIAMLLRNTVEAARAVASRS